MDTGAITIITMDQCNGSLNDVNCNPNYVFSNFVKIFVVDCRESQCGSLGNGDFA